MDEKIDGIMFGVEEWHVKYALKDWWVFFFGSLHLLDYFQSTLNWSKTVRLVGIP